jgi:hypothetical protein
MRTAGMKNEYTFRTQVNMKSRTRINNSKTKRSKKNRKAPIRLTSLTDRITLPPKQSVIPLHKTVQLHYIDGTLIRNNVGANYLTFNMRFNSAYDPDPLLLSGGISGFAEMAKFYTFYRVLRTTVSWSVSNKETSPVSVGFVCSGAPLTISTQASAIDILENGLSVGPALLSASGGQDRIMLTNSYYLPQVWGNPSEYKASDFFGSSVTTNPAGIIVGQFIAYSSANFLNGIDSNLRLTMTVKFYGRIPLEG